MRGVLEGLFKDIKSEVCCVGSPGKQGSDQKEKQRKTDRTQTASHATAFLFAEGADARRLGERGRHLRHLFFVLAREILEARQTSQASHEAFPEGPVHGNQK